MTDQIIYAFFLHFSEFSNSVLGKYHFCVDILNVIET